METNSKVPFRASCNHIYFIEYTDANTFHSFDIEFKVNEPKYTAPFSPPPFSIFFLARGRWRSYYLFMCLCIYVRCLMIHPFVYYLQLENSFSIIYTISTLNPYYIVCVCIHWIFKILHVNYDCLSFTKRYRQHKSHSIHRRKTAFNTFHMILSKNHWNMFQCTIFFMYISTFYENLIICDFMHIEIDFVYLVFSTVLRVALCIMC